jgi:hypothetical protein
MKGSAVDKPKKRYEHMQFFRAEPDVREAIERASLNDNRSRSDWCRLRIIEILEREGYLSPRKRTPGRSPIGRKPEEVKS